MTFLRTLVVLALACHALVSVGGLLTADQKAAFTKHGVQIFQHGSEMGFYHSGAPSHPYGPFPGPHNPNTVSARGHRFFVPTAPNQRSSAQDCLNMGPIGIAVNGIPFFNPYTNEGYDAVSGGCSEVFDSCNGHPDQHGIYHYHQIPNCVYKGGNDEILGVALDGYLIYGPKNASGSAVQASDLDKCGGTIGPDGVYRYHAQYKFPYIIGCYHGDLSTSMSHRVHGCSVARQCPWNGAVGKLKKMSAISA